MVDLLALLSGVLAGSIAMTLLVLGLRRAPVPAPARHPRAEPTGIRTVAPSPASSPAAAHVNRPAAPGPAPPADATRVWPGRGAATRLDLEDGSAGVDLGDQPVTLGRGSDQTLRIHDSRASRAHAVVRPRRTGGWELADDGSANGTMLNGHRIPEGKVAPLRDGDRIGIGAVTVLYTERRSEPPAAPPGPHDDPTRIA